MFFYDNRDFNRWIGYMISYKYMIVGYMFRPIMFFVEVPIDSKINKEVDKEVDEKCQDQ